MPGRDEPVDSTLDALLQKYERAEAVVLREELVAFLKSPECRSALAEAVQKPIETIVQSALSNPKFQEQIRDAVIRSLQPELVRAAQTAATNALKNVSVTIPEELQQRMRRDAEESVRSTLSHAPRQTRESRNPGIDPALRKRIFAGVGVVVFLALATWAYFFFTKRDQRTDVAALPTDPEVTETLTPSDPEPQPQPQSRLFDTYRAALDQVGVPNLNPPAGAELVCVERAIQNAESSGNLDVAALRTSLNACAATRSRPAAPSRMIAGVQAQLTEESRTRTCGALQPVGIDGRHGNETSRALATYVRCTAPAGVPVQLETLGDYAAVGVYFIHKRMREAG